MTESRRFRGTSGRWCGPLCSENELKSVCALLARPRAGGAFVLRGEAGVGKSALLSEVVFAGQRADVRVLATAGVSLQMQQPFAGLSHLMRSVLNDPALPDRHLDARDTCCRRSGARTCGSGTRSAWRTRFLRCCRVRGGLEHETGDISPDAPSKCRRRSYPMWSLPARQLLQPGVATGAHSMTTPSTSPWPSWPGRRWERFRPTPTHRGVPLPVSAPVGGVAGPR